jgi:hypothetical protein
MKVLELIQQHHHGDQNEGKENGSDDEYEDADDFFAQ